MTDHSHDNPTPASLPRKRLAVVDQGEVEQLKAAQNLLVDAANAAEGLLPALEKRRIELARELSDLETQVVRLRTIVVTAAAYKQQKDEDSGAYEAVIDGAARPDIDQVLFQSFGPMSASEIREQIKTRTGHDWAASTISNHLSRGKAHGRYLNENGSWKLTTKGLGDML